MLSSSWTILASLGEPEAKEICEGLMIVMTLYNSLTGEIRPGMEAAGNSSTEERNTCIEIEGEDVI